MTRFLPLFGRRGSQWLVVAVCLSAAALVWTGYRAITEWEQAAAQVASRRAQAAVDLLVAALARDMRGGQQLMLTSADRDGLTMGASSDLLRPIGSALARYPYPEVFFSWRDSPTPESVLFYSRPERRPAWLAAASARRLFPVVVEREPGMAEHLITRVVKDTTQGRRFSVFDLNAGAPYQVVALVSYADPLRERPAGVLGFMVNLEWAREHYFADLVAQVARIEGSDHAIQFSLVDEAGRIAVGAAADQGAPPARRQSFPMAFFDPLIVAVDPPGDLRVASWTAVADAGHDPTLAAAERGARRTLGVAAVMALALTIGLWLSLEAGRASETLADMRADFVSAVTHELKTPIANMRAIHETLASGRVTLETCGEYAAMGIREATRLSRLVDNLLAYARITDVAHAYAFEAVSVETVVDRSVKEFASNLAHGDFHVHVDIPEGLPAVKGDPTALNLMLNNLLDNAIRYSKDRRDLTITGRSAGHTLTLEVADKGVGIPEEDIQRVTRKFWRGPASHAGGSGLGLAIVDRIVADHKGSLEIRSRVDVGTSVLVTLPLAEMASRMAQHGVKVGV
jgi:signal transduction histidine kinase